MKLRQTQSVRLQDYVPDIESYLSQEVVDQFRSLAFTEQDLDLNPDEAIYVGFTKDLKEAEEILGGQEGFIISQNHFLLRAKDQVILDQGLSDVNRLRQAKTSQEFIKVLSEDWFASNRPAILLVNFLNIAGLVWVSNFIFVLGVSGLLSLMRLNQAFSIRNFKEGLTMSLYSLGGASLLACLAGMIFLNPLEMFSLQSMLFILILILSYWQTHFNDDYLASIEERGA